MPIFTPPPHYPRVRVVQSFQELVETPFAGEVNALCWPRALAGDFGEVAELIEAGEGITRLDEEQLRSLAATDAGRVAIEAMLEDQRQLREHGFAPELNCIRAYPRDDSGGAVPTDVYSFHADSAPVEAETWLCTYHGAPSEGLRNEEAQRKVDLAETRAALRLECGEEEGDHLEEYLRENCYHLHYAPSAEARPFSFGRHHLWRIAVAWPGSPVPPCIHRAPATEAGDPPRLLLIS